MLYRVSNKLSQIRAHYAANGEHPKQITVIMHHIHCRICSTCWGHEYGSGCAVRTW